MTFLRAYRIDQVLDSCIKDKEMPHIFYGKYIWLCRNDEDKCAAIDILAKNLREQFKRHEIRAPFFKQAAKAKEELGKITKIHRG